MAKLDINDTLLFLQENGWPLEVSDNFVSLWVEDKDKEVFIETPGSFYWSWLEEAVLLHWLRNVLLTKGRLLTVAPKVSYKNWGEDLKDVQWSARLARFNVANGKHGAENRSVRDTELEAALGSVKGYVRDRNKGLP